MNRQATELENVRRTCKTRKPASNSSDGIVSKETMRNEPELTSLVRVLLGAIQAKYAHTMKSQDRQDFLTLTDEVILVTKDIR
ncbi:MAG: hypothetical protein E6K98_02835 [Thaumarchaeota archaeon]|nr:MAG: hypothetical protein E6K98_02835 [Nitrososphaerota archaeon]TLX95003.1 MAG: hypothetical protein E6K91_04255 [Nitrososphaerota archaeon]